MKTIDYVQLETHLKSAIAALRLAIGKKEIRNKASDFETRRKLTPVEVAIVRECGL